MNLNWRESHKLELYKVWKEPKEEKYHKSKLGTSLHWRDIQVKYRV